MIKKVVLIGVGVGLLGLLVLGTGAMSYVRTSASYVKDSVHNTVPIEFQIKRARRMIEDLVPEVRKNMHVIAKEEVEVERLEKEIAQLTEESAQDKDHLMRLKGDLETGRSV